MAINLRKQAKGRECMIRIPGICNHNPETTVLCHLNNKRLFGVGTGMKVPDIFAAWGCSACHDAVDGRNNRLVAEMGLAGEIDLYFYEGVFRTQNILLKEGKL